MAYVGITNRTVSNGGAADLLYATYGAMVSASWDCLGSGTGAAGGYSSSGSLITSAATFNSNGAWVRMREPGGVGGREYVFMRGDTGVKALIKYSRSTGFGSGSPAAAQAPTTGTSGDGQVILGTAGDTTSVAAAQSATFCGSAGYVQGVASTTSLNGTYGFWSFQYAASTGVIGGLFLTEGVAVGSTSTSDGDPSWRLATPSANITYWWAQTVSTVSFWEKYGTANSSYKTAGDIAFYRSIGSTGAGGNAVIPLNLGQDPYESKVAFYPALIGKTNVFPKGFSSGLAIGTTSQNQMDVFNYSTSEPRIAINTAGNGITGYPLIVVPWVPNVVPII